MPLEVAAGELSATDRVAQPRGNGWQAVLGRLLSFPVLLAAGLAVITFFTVSTRFYDPDLWWHLKVGQIIAATHSIPSTDIFSYTTHQHAWTAHEWLAQLMMYGVYAAAGYRGLMLWLAVLASAIFILVYVRCWRQCHNPLLAFLGGMFAWLFGTVGLAVRPLIFGYCFLAVELLLVELALSGKRRCLWFLPPLFALWANCHGSYYFGLAVLGVYWLCSQIQGNWGFLVSEKSSRQLRNTLGAILLLCTVAICCNPVGVRLLIYPFDALFHQTASMNSIDEWLPADLRSLRGVGMLGAFLGICLLGCWRRSELRLREFLLTLMVFGMAVQHSRMLFLFGLIVSPILCRLAAPLMPAHRDLNRPLANAVLLCGAIAAIVAAFPSAAAIERQIRHQGPADAVDYIRRAHLAGPMLNSYGFGGYLIWTLPEEKVFIDGRGDVFDWTGVLAEYGRWATLQADPNELLQKYHIRFCLLEKDAPMARVMPYLPGWHLAYSDAAAVIFAR